MTAAAFSQPPADKGRLRSIFGQFATGVTVVAAGGETPCGMTANSFTSVSLDPPVILICLTRDSELCKAVLREGRFAVSVLAADQEDVARYFANHSRPRGAEEFGTLQAGMRADFLVLDGNPLQDIHNTEKLSAVWQSGKIVPSVSAKMTSGN